MLYTVGDYDENIIETIKEGKCFKIGKNNDLNCKNFNPNYSGGIVFKTKEDAYKYIIDTKFKGAKIFGLNTDETNVYGGDDGYLYLIDSCLLVYL